MADISIKRAALLNAASRYAAVLMGIFFTMILARLLSPAEYGIVAVTIVFTNLFSIFADMGLSAGIIQDKKLTQDDNNGIFLFSLLLAVFLAVAFFLCSFGIANFYQNAVYVPLGAILAVSLFFSTINMVPNALLLKDKDFVLIAKRNVAIPLITSPVTVGMAAAGLSYYALVLQSLFSAALTFGLNYFTVYRRYGLIIPHRFDFHGVRRIFNYSLFQFLFSLVNYFARNLDNLLVGKFFGTAALGFYDKAYRLMVYPSSMLTHVITPVLQPVLSEYQDDRQYIYAKYIKIVKFLSLCGVFIVAFCYFGADEIVLILFGAQWEPAVPYFAWLSLSVWGQMIMGTTGSIYLSVGDSKHSFVCGCITTVMTIIAITLGILSNDLLAVARNVSLSYILQFVIVMYILMHYGLRQPYWPFLRIFWPEAVMAVVLGGVGQLLLQLPLESVLCRAAIKFLVIGGVFALLCWLLGQVKYMRSLHR